MPVLVVTLLAGCEEKAVAQRLSGRISVRLVEERLQADGGAVSLEAFSPLVARELSGRGMVVVAEGGADVRLAGTVSLKDEPRGESSVGGPMAFFFVRGAYDLRLEDGATGAALGRVQGPLDLRGLKEQALGSASTSYEATVDALAKDAAPRIADQLARKLVESGRGKAR